MANKIIYQPDTGQFITVPSTGGTAKSVFVQTATGTVANTVAETPLTSTGIGSLTLPANFFTVGRTLLIKGSGIHSAVSNPNIRIKIKLGSTVILDTGNVSSLNSTNTEIDISGTITCRTIGATGTIFAQGSYTESGGQLFGMPNVNPITIDTTVSQTLSITAQWSAANVANTTSLTNLVVQFI